VARFQRLTFLLEKSAAYSSIIGAEINKKKYVLQKPSKPTRNVTEGRKRLRTDDPDPSDQDYGFSKRTKTNYGQSKLGGNLIHAPRMKQPKLVTGGKLKDYQLEGVEWMISLDQNGISGILGESWLLNPRCSFQRRILHCS
jgi:ATP-dependent DNA helicase